MVVLKRGEVRKVFFVLIDRYDKPIDYTEEDWIFELVVKKTKGQSQEIFKFGDTDADKSLSRAGLIGFKFDLSASDAIVAGDYYLEIKVSSTEWDFIEISPTILFRIEESCF